MKKHYKISESSPKGWNDWLKGLGFGASFCQTNYWADLNQQANNVTNYWLEVLCDTQRTAGILFSLSQNKDLISTGGPVIADASDLETYALLFKGIIELSQKAKAAQMMITSLTPIENKQLDAEILDLFSKNGFEKILWKTSLINLQYSEDELFASLSKSTRKGIRKCQQNDLSVFKCETEEDFMSLFWLSRDPDAHDLDKGKIIWQQNQHKSYDFYVTLDAEQNMLAALGTYSFNGVVTEISSYRSTHPNAQKYAVQDILHWEIIKNSKSRGNAWFDLAGYSPSPKGPKEEGIKRFKNKWGGEERDLYIFSKDLRPTPIKMLSKLKKLLKK